MLQDPLKLEGRQQRNTLTAIDDKLIMSINWSVNAMYLRLVDDEITSLVLSSMHSVSRLFLNSCSSHHGINFFYVVEKTSVICV